MGIIENIDKVIHIFSLTKQQSEAENDNLSDNINDSYKDRNVLVGVVRNKGQFYKLLKYKFYHIPMSKISGCEMPIKYVAIYQSKKLFGRKCGVYYYAEVKDYKTVLRYQIREIRKQSDEPYLYIRVKRWQRLPRRIMANGMEDIAFSTTMPLMMKAKDVSELQIRSKDEYEFYKSLVKTVKSLIKNRIPSHEDMIYGDFTIKLQGGLLYLYFCDVVQYVIGFDVFLQTPMKVIKDIFDYYPEK